jgi:hypothetical protein
MTCGRLYLYDTLLQRLPQDLEDMAAELGPCIQEEHAVVGQRHFARHWHVAPDDQPDIGDGVVRGATRPGRDQRGALAGEARDAIDARGLNGLSQGHGGQDGGEPPGQGGRARPRGAEEEQIWVPMPASGSASSGSPGMPIAFHLIPSHNESNSGSHHDGY